MTKAELIKALEKYPDDMEVRVVGSDNYLEVATEVYKQTAFMNRVFIVIR